ncbi:Sec-independent protein translocase subunit TatA [Nocardia sp. NPDC050712]|uniref:Sec-independent protein translocase subunit TatA n=1 Tax=Nocardia sp. NPDC050712 TaxID=3155518 RepID=UPI0034047414
MGGLSVSHWVIILVVVVLLFGAKRLPDAARGLGRSLRIFKSEVSQMQNEGNSSADAPQPAPQQLPPAQPVHPAPQPQAQPESKSL